MQSQHVAVAGCSTYFGLAPGAIPHGLATSEVQHQRKIPSSASSEVIQRAASLDIETCARGK